MLTPEEQELLGVAMVTRLRLAHVRPREWSDSDASRPEPKRRRGSTDAPLSVPSWTVVQCTPGRRSVPDLGPRGHIHLPARGRRRPPDVDARRAGITGSGDGNSAEGWLTRPEPKRRRGSTDAPLSVPSWPGSDEATRVWGGPVPEVVGTSSLASGDAPMLTPDENMSSAGGGSQGSPGLEPIGVYMATTGATAGQPHTAEQPKLYVPVAEYPPGQGARPPTPALPRTAPPVRNDGPGGSEEETKSDVPMTTRGPHLSENSRDQNTAPPVRNDGPGGSEEETKSDVPMTTRGPHLSENSRGQDRDMQEADRQIAELRAALATRDELDRIRNEEYRVARTAQAAQANLSQEAWDRREAEFQERTAREMERRKVSGQDFAGLQAQMYLLEKERAQEREESIQFRAEADRRMEAVTEKRDQAISKATAAIDETKFQADEELSRIRREMEHQARVDRAREAREVELQEAQFRDVSRTGRCRTLTTPTAGACVLPALERERSGKR
ncbi:hypothetical protein PHMEG_00031995 [Phytophthora megakarya]|uniref:Uncharacterized protein n=1 Tax=Phytophthora megakarya TaxID=4795 RepID=A0A225UWU7_9STRA|nr:hypothetical protein PHMEG_00031995 [Phytophthora megakarya]